MLNMEAKLEILSGKTAGLSTLTTLALSAIPTTPDTPNPAIVREFVESWGLELAIAIVEMIARFQNNNSVDWNEVQISRSGLFEVLEESRSLLQEYRSIEELRKALP